MEEKKNLNIVVVDDEKEDLDIVREVFRSLNTRPSFGNLSVTYSLGIDAAITEIISGIANRKPINLLLTDYLMVGTDSKLSQMVYNTDGTGNSLAKFAKERIPEVKVIGHTGGESSSFDRSYVDLATKKIRDADSLYEKIREAVGR
jgi:CheY-like chemotaxis protein